MNSYVSFNSKDKNANEVVQRIRFNTQDFTLKSITALSSDSFQVSIDMYNVNQYNSRFTYDDGATTNFIDIPEGYYTDVTLAAALLALLPVGWTLALTGAPVPGYTLTSTVPITLIQDPTYRGNVAELLGFQLGGALSVSHVASSAPMVYTPYLDFVSSSLHTSQSIRDYTTANSSDILFRVYLDSPDAPTVKSSYHVGMEPKLIDVRAFSAMGNVTVEVLDCYSMPAPLLPSSQYNFLLRTIAGSEFENVF